MTYKAGGFVRVPEHPGHVVAQPREREFHVWQKGKGATQVQADTCQITDAGALIFQNNGSLVIAFSPVGWTFMEEVEVND